MTAVGGTGMMRRAYLEAAAYAVHRQAFGQPIGGFPAVRRTLADMASVSAGALHLVLELTGLEDRIDCGNAADADVLLHRFLVNLAKYLVSGQATDVVHAAIEVLGGNGAIEDFSVLPRLYRDAMVYESWEGSHNVLVAQVLTDLRRLPILDEVERWLRGLVGSVADDSLAAQLGEAIDAALGATRTCMADAVVGAWRFRDVVGRIGLLAETCLLAVSGDDAMSRHLVATRLTPGSRPEDDPDLVDRVEAVLAASA